MATTHDHSALIRNIQLATGVTTVAATGLLAASAHMLFRFAIDTQWKHSIFHQALIAPDREGKMNQGEAKEAEQWFSETKQPVSITSRDGLKLHAICVHGYTGAPEEQAKWAHRYARMGFTVLAPSQRAQDLSEGRYVGMGWLERNDLLDWIRLIVDSDDQARILLFGGSMGATTVMMTTGTPELPRNVIAAIAESGYTSARMEFIDSARGMFHMPKLLASACVDAAGLICKRRAGYDFTEASCIPSSTANVCWFRTPIIWKAPPWIRNATGTPYTDSSVVHSRSDSRTPKNISGNGNASGERWRPSPPEVLKTCPMPVPSVPFSRIAYLHGDAILHNMESMLLIERGILAFLRHNLDIQVIVVPLLDHADKMSGNAAPLVFRIDQHIVHVCHHHQTHQTFAIPCAEYGG